MDDATRFASLSRRASRGLMRLERDSVCCGDVTWQQFETLRLLHEAGAMTTGAIADRLGIELSTASRNLAVLERSGYLARARDPRDGRQITNALTAKGRRAVTSLCCDETTVLGAVLERVPANRRAAVLDGLAALCDALEPTLTDARGCAPAAAANTSDHPTACCPAAEPTSRGTRP